jgi:signal transduction histidine kinase
MIPGGRHARLITADERRHQRSCVPDTPHNMVPLSDTILWRPDIHVKFTAGDVSESLVPELETTIYRICQESLNNVFKHSRASQVEVRFVAGPDAAVLCIEDNGCGFQVEETMIHAALAGNVGLRGMRERAQVLGGSLTVKSEPGHGTLVEARIPYTLEN